MRWRGEGEANHHLFFLALSGFSSSLSGSFVPRLKMEWLLQREYEAAGVLVVSAIGNQLYVLLPYENTGGTRRCKYVDYPDGCRMSDEECEFIHIRTPGQRPEEKEMDRIKILGGRRERHLNETEDLTAARELSEETAGIIPPADAHYIIRSQEPHEPLVLPGKYRLYLRYVDIGHYGDIARRYNEMTSKPKGAEAIRLFWWPVRDFLKPLFYDEQRGPCLTLSSDDGSRREEPFRLPVYHLLSTVLTRFSAPLRAYMYNLSLRLFPATQRPAIE